MKTAREKGGAEKELCTLAQAHETQHTNEEAVRKGNREQDAKKRFTNRRKQEKGSRCA